MTTYKITWMTVVEADNEERAVEESLLLMNNDPRFEPYDIEILDEADS